MGLILLTRHENKKKYETKKLSQVGAIKKPEGDFYRYVVDLGYAAEISREKFDALAKEEDPETACEMLLDQHHKTISIDWKWGPEELLGKAEDCIPGFTYSFISNVPGTLKEVPYRMSDTTPIYHYVGDICGEPVDTETTIEFFMPAVVNPIIEKKYNAQFLFAFPGSDAFNFVLVSNERVEQVKANTCFGTYADMEQFYGCKK